MSILIKGMEMPPSCRYCDFRHMSLTQNAFCTAAHETIDYMDERTKRLDKCPLVEVPTPHGRLIDADDAHIDADERGFDFWACDADIDSAQEFLKAQPTIIEAEEEQ